MIVRRATVAAAVLLALAPPSLAASGGAQRAAARAPVRPGNAPRSIGKFEDWQAATHTEGDQTVCYAFTRSTASTPALSGRGEVVLTVTERTTPRDAVAMSVGFTFANNAEAQMLVDGASHPFYTEKRNAFARDGKALVAAFTKGRTAQAKLPGPRNTTVTDSFSLRGFSAAYLAIVKACPAK